MSFPSFPSVPPSFLPSPDEIPRFRLPSPRRPPSERGGTPPKFRFPWQRSPEPEQIPLDEFIPAPQGGYPVQEAKYPFKGGQVQGKLYTVYYDWRYKRYNWADWQPWNNDVSIGQWLLAPIISVAPYKSYSNLGVQVAYSPSNQIHTVSNVGGSNMAADFSFEIRNIRVVRQDGTSATADEAQGGNPAPIVPPINTPNKRPPLPELEPEEEDKPSPFKVVPPYPAKAPSPTPVQRPAPVPDPAPIPVPDPDPFPDPAPIPVPDPNPYPEIFPNPDPTTPLSPSPNPLPLAPSPLPTVPNKSPEEDRKSPPFDPDEIIPILERLIDGGIEVSPAPQPVAFRPTEPPTQCESLKECFNEAMDEREEQEEEEKKNNPIKDKFVRVSVTRFPTQDKFFNPSSSGVGERVLIAGYLRFTRNGETIGVESEVRRQSQLFYFPEYANGFDLYPCYGAALEGEVITLTRG